MIDPKLVREDLEGIRAMLKKRNMESAVDPDELGRIDEERRSVIAKADELREKRNRVSKEIGKLKSGGGDASVLMAEMSGVNDGIRDLEAAAERLDAAFNELMLSLPNVLSDTVPVGRDENDNVVVRTWGEKPVFDFQPKPHYDLGTELGILDFERGVKLSGTRFYVYRDLAAKLERAIINFMLDLHTTEHGYSETFAPFVVNDDSMIGTGQYPKFRDEYYQIGRAHV